MSTIILSDMIKPRSEQQWQSVELLASAARTKATDAGTVGTAFYIGDWDKICIVHDITAAAGDATTDHLTMVIEMSMDNLAWYDVGTFTKFEGNDAVTREQMIFIPGQRYVADPNIIVIGSAECASGAVRNHLVGRYIRASMVIADNAGNASFTSSVMAAVMRNDIVRQESEMKEIVLIPLAIYDASKTSEIWEIGDHWDFMQVVLRTTNHDTAGADKLDTYIDLSMDGVKWVNVASFTQCDGDDGPWVELVTLIPGLADNVDAIIVATADLAETVVFPGFAGGFLRARFVVTDDTTPLFTASLKAYVK